MLPGIVQRDIATCVPASIHKRHPPLPFCGFNRFPDILKRQQPSPLLYIALLPSTFRKPLSQSFDKLG